MLMYALARQDQDLTAQELPGSSHFLEFTDSSSEVLREIYYVPGTEGPTMKKALHLALKLYTVDSKLQS